MTRFHPRDDRDGDHVRDRVRYLRQIKTPDEIQSLLILAVIAGLVNGLIGRSCGSCRSRSR